MPQPRRNGGGQAPAQRRNNAARGARCAKFKKKSPDFHYRAGLTIGGIQLVAGILSVILSRVVVTFYHWDVIGYPSVGFWAGIVFYVPAGILGIAAKKQHTFIIYLYMTWSIFSALVGPFMTIFEGVVAGVGSLVFVCKGLLGPLFGEWPFNIVVNEGLCEKFGVEEAIYIHGMLAFIGLIEFVVSIVGSAFCCDGLCCGRSKRVAPVDVNV